MNHPLETLFIDSRSLKTLKIVAHENHIIMVPCMMNKIDILKIKSNRDPSNIQIFFLIK